MRILLTNDDGIKSPGLKKLLDTLKKEHEVWVVAPEKEMSGSSHSISLKNPIRVRKSAENIFSCTGTPVDCILLGFKYLIPEDIDMVISGINMGPNLGTDILYSGTVAAAREGALLEKPSLALSLSGTEGHYDFDAPVEFVSRNVETFRSIWSGDHFVNINFPENTSQGSYSIAVTFPSRRIYRDRFETFTAPDGSIFCFLAGDDPHSHREDGSDYCAVLKGAVSISPVLIHPANHSIEEKYRKRFCVKSLKKGSVPV